MGSSQFGLSCNFEPPFFPFFSLIERVMSNDRRSAISYYDLLADVDAESDTEPDGFAVSPTLRDGSPSVASDAVTVPDGIPDAVANDADVIPDTIPDAITDAVVHDADAIHDAFPDADADADADGRAASVGVAVGVPIDYSGLYDIALWEVREDPVFDVSFLLPYGTPYGEGYSNGIAAISALRSLFQIAIFKIGVCANPWYRFNNMKYGYHFWGYTTMAILFQGSPTLCGPLETDLITHFRGTPGLQNVKAGDDNTPQEEPCFTYCVVCDCDKLIRAGPNRRRGVVRYS